MAETEPNLVENTEAQIFSMQETDQHNIVGEFDQQNFVADVPEVYQFAGNESENQILALSGQEFSGNESVNQRLALSGQEFSGNESVNQSLSVNEQNFGGNEHENNIGVISEQNYAENVDEHAVDEDQTIQELDENQLNQEFADNEASELGNAQIDSDLDKKDKHENNLAGEGEEKKWPGWPGESVFRMLVPGQKVGNVIGRKGEYIKKIVEETRARIKVLDGPPGSQERAVMVSAKEEPESSLPPAMDGLLRVHRRIVDGLDGDSTEVPPAGGKVSTRLLVPATQAGSLIGKQGASVKTIQEAANCVVRVLGEADLPAFALQDDRVVEVVGEAVNVHKAIELIASQLRKFLVDRGIISVFEKQMQAPNNPREHFPPQPWGPHHGLPPTGGGGYGSNMQYMPPPRQLDNYYPPANMPPPDRQAHQGISSFGREPSANAQAAPSMITQITQHIQVPLIYADSVIGSSGSTISYIRRASGATVTVQETRGVPGEMTVEINGTASQVQAAQQLVQNFLAEAAAASAAPTQTGGATDQGYSQGYNSYAAPASAPAYGSVYGGSYGY